ncbi:competence protein ComEC [Leifsonia shinshuensis]|nr:competence protein ComEC [Leifsonia shinshuensis]
MPDLRLALPAVCLWATCAVLIGLTDAAAAVCAAAAIGAAAFIGVAVARARRKSVRPLPAGRSRVGRDRPGRVLACVAVMLGAVALGAGVVAAQAPGRDAQDLDRAARRSDVVQVVVRVERPPHRMAGGFGSEPRWTLRGTTVEEPRGVPVSVQFDAAPDQARAFALGATARAEGVPRRDDPGEATSYTVRSAGADAVRITEPPPPWLAWAAAARTTFAAAAARTPGDGGTLLPGLAIGDETDLSPALDEAMTASSLSHLTAVSGANCALVIGLVFLIARAAGAGRRTRIVAAGAALAGFVALVGPGASVIRAAAMAGVVLIGLARGRPADGVPALALAGIVLLVHDPWLARDYGFVLSALATTGLLVLAGPLATVLTRWMPRALALALAIPTAAQLACQPVLVLLSPTLPLYGVPANLLAEPAAPIATMLGCLACAVLPWAPALGELIVRLAWLPAAWIAQVATAMSALPGVALPWAPGPLGVALSGAVLVAVAVLVLGRRAPRAVAIVACAALLIGVVGYVGALGGAAVGRAVALPADWQLAACDVGQGDALLLRDGDAVGMIDVGRHPEPATACLDRLGIQHIDVLILSHFDADHVGGVEGVASRVRRAIVQRPVRDADERTLDVLRAAGVPVERGSAGLHGELGALSWRLLWPTATGGSGMDSGGSGMDTGNPGSLTVEAEGRGLRSLFLGDLGEEAQDAVLATRAVRPVDVVKVAHHGSADQSPAMYRALGARLGLVSVGVHNGYGHPTRRALDLLASCGTPVARTDEQGLVLVSPGPDGIRVWSERPPASSAGGPPYPGGVNRPDAGSAQAQGDTWRPEPAAEVERARRGPPRAPSRSSRGTRSARPRWCSSRVRRASSPTGPCAHCATHSRPTTPVSRSAICTRGTTRRGSCSPSRAPPCSVSRASSGWTPSRSATTRSWPTCSTT